MNKSFEIIPYLNRVSKLEEELKSAYDMNAQYVLQMNDIQELNTNLGQVFHTLNQIFLYLNTITNTLRPNAPSETMNNLEVKLEHVKQAIDEGYYNYTTIFNEMLRIQSEPEVPTMKEAFIKTTQKLEAEKGINAQLTETVQQLKFENEKIAEELAEKQNTAEVLIQQTTAQKERLLEEKEKLLLQLETRSAALASVAQEHTECEKRRKELGIQTSEIQVALQDCLSTKQDLTVQLETLVQQQTTLQQQYAEALKDLNETQVRILTVDQEVQRTADELQRTEAELQRTEAEREVSGEQLQKTAAELEESKRYHSELLEAKGRLETELDGLRKTYVDLETELEASRDLITSLETELKTADSRMSQMHSALTESNARREELEVELTTLSQKVNTSDEQVTDSQFALDKIKAYILAKYNQADPNKSALELVTDFIKVCENAATQLNQTRAYIFANNSIEDRNQTTFSLVRDVFITLKQDLDKQKESSDACTEQFNSLRQMILRYRQTEDSDEVDKNNFRLISRYLAHLHEKQDRNNSKILQFNETLQNFIDQFPRVPISNIDAVTFEPRDVELNRLKKNTVILLTMLERTMNDMAIQLGEAKAGEKKRNTQADVKLLIDWFVQKKHNLTPQAVQALEDQGLTSPYVHNLRQQLAEYFRFIGPQLQNCRHWGIEIGEFTNWLNFYNTYFPNVDLQFLESHHFTATEIENLKNSLLVAMRRLGSTVLTQIGVSGALQGQGQTLLDEVNVLTQWLREDYNIKFDYETLKRFQFASDVNLLKTELIQVFTKEKEQYEDLNNSIVTCNRYLKEEQRDIQVEKNSVFLYCQKLLHLFYYNLVYYRVTLNLLQNRLLFLQQPKYARVAEQSIKDTLSKIQYTIFVSNVLQNNIISALPLIRAKLSGNPVSMLQIDNIMDETTSLGDYITETFQSLKICSDRGLFVYPNTQKENKIENLFHAYTPLLAEKCIRQLGDSEAKQEPLVTTEPLFILPIQETFPELVKYIIAKANIRMYELFMQHEPVNTAYYDSLFSVENAIPSPTLKPDGSDVLLAVRYFKTLRPFQTKACLNDLEEFIRDERDVPAQVKALVVQELSALPLVKYADEDTTNLLINLCNEAKYIITNLSPESLRNLNSVAQKILTFLSSLEGKVPLDIFFDNNKSAHQFVYHYQLLLVSTSLLGYIRQEIDTTVRLGGENVAFQI
jgi:hypothetical protein